MYLLFHDTHDQLTNSIRLLFGHSFPNAKKEQKSKDKQKSIPKNGHGIGNVYVL